MTASSDYSDHIPVLDDVGELSTIEAPLDLATARAIVGLWGLPPWTVQPAAAGGVWITAEAHMALIHLNNAA